MGEETGLVILGSSLCFLTGSGRGRLPGTGGAAAGDSGCSSERRERADIGEATWAPSSSALLVATGGGGTARPIQISQP